MRYLAVAVLSACVAARVAAAAPCPVGISPDTAQRLFDMAKKAELGDEYHLDGGSAAATQWVVNWSRHGQPCPPIQVVIGGCTLPLMNPGLVLSVAPELRTQCPGLQPLVDEIANALPAERLFGQQLEPPAAARPFMLAAAIVLALSGLLIRRLLPTTAAPRIDWRDAAWILFVIGATLPFSRNLPLAVHLELGLAWIALAMLLIRLFAYDLLSGESRAHKQLLAALFAGTLLLDGSLSTGGPGDLHLNLSYIWGSALELRWGPAPIALFRLLGFFFDPVRDVHVLGCSLVLGACLPLLLYGIVRELGIAKTPALLAAVVTAAHPLLIVFSGVLNRQTPYLFATFGSVLALISVLKRGRGGDLLAFVLATVLAVTSRPEGVQVLVVHGAALMLVASTMRRRAAVAGTLGLLAAAAFLYTHHALELKPPSNGNSVAATIPMLWTIVLDRNFTPLAWIAAWTTGLLVGIRQRAAWVASLSLFGMDLLWRWSHLYRMFVGHPQQVASSRYEMILLIPFAIGVALLFALLARTSTARKLSFAVVFVAATAATSGDSYDTLLKPFAVDYEYHFLKQHAATLPAGARLYILDAPFDDMGFIDAHQVGEFVASTATFRAWSGRRCEDLTADLSQTYLYIGSACAELVENPLSPLPAPGYEQWLADCAAIRHRVAGDAVDEVEVPARKMSWHYFKQPRLRLGLYRLRDASLCEIGPRLQVAN